MEENKNPEPEEKPAENIPEVIHPPGETDIPETEELQTTNYEPQTEEMEVHKHPHHVTHKKKWGEYLLEFLMLFVAVFLGFLAENQREHMVEHQREEKFIQSLSSDLESDINRLQTIIQLRNERARLLDSFSILLNSREALRQSNDLYYYNSFATRGVAFRFTPVDGTMQQLKNGGNLRLIRKSVISDSIISYDVSVRAFMWGTNDEEEIMRTYRNIAEGVFDGVVLNNMRDEDNNVNRISYIPAIRLNDDTKYRLNYRIHMLTVFNKTMRKEAKKLLGQGQQLNDLLKKQYHLENE